MTLSIDVLLYNWDSYYDHGRNFYIYYDSTTSQFNWIPWDYNLAFSETEVDLMLTNISGSGGFGGGPISKPLNDNILFNTELKEDYFRSVCLARKYIFNLAAQESYIDDMAAIIRSDLNADPNKFYSIADFDTNVETDASVTTVDQFGFPATETFPGIKSFIQMRYDGIEAEIANEGYNCSELFNSIKTINTSTSFTIFPNPTNEMINITFRENNGIEIILYNAIGIEMYRAHLIKGINYTQIDVRDFAAGIYILSIGNEQQKIVVE
ncbi:MAG: CotH kinase family protein [Flavobacteriales bacterium]|nr:CotH kinase family protein [Flavobacteriales bacterium]